MLTSWSDARSLLGANAVSKRRARPAAWSLVYHRLFCERTPDDPATGSGLLLPTVAPEHPSRALELAVDAHDEGHLKPTQLRLVGNNVLHSTYALDGKGRSHFRRLCCRVQEIQDERRWEEALQGFEGTEDLYAKPRRVRSLNADSMGIETDAPRPTVPTPSKDPAHHLQYLDVTFDGRTTTLSFEIVLPMPKDQIIARIDPRTWAKFDPVHFLETREVSVENINGKPIKSGNGKLGKSGETSWRGKYLERFVLPWNTAMLSLFEVVLHVDVSIHDEGARTDYNLYDEKDGQLVRDSGFVILRKMPGHPNWSVVTAQKSTAFQSPIMNALNPALLATWMQDQITTFWSKPDDSTAEPE